MRKTVIIGKSNTLDEDMDYLELHVDNCFRISEKYNLNPEYKERTYLGRLFAENNYVALQIAEYEATIYMPEHPNNYQLNTILDYIDRYSTYFIVDNRFDEFGEIKMTYFELLRYINTLKLDTLKKSM